MQDAASMAARRGEQKEMLGRDQCQTSARARTDALFHLLAETCGIVTDGRANRMDCSLRGSIIGTPVQPIRSGKITNGRNRQAFHIHLRPVPLGRIILETDSPYLAPVPHRGKRNESSYVALVAERVAEIVGVEVHEVARSTTENAVRLFGLQTSAPVS